MRDKARILVIDGERCDQLHYLLEGEGYEVARAHSGAEALTKVQKERFHLVLADVLMSGDDELELLRSIKRVSQDTRVIVMTARSSLAMALRAVECGASDYLTKPLDDTGVVLAAVAQALEEREPERDAREYALQTRT